MNKQIIKRHGEPSKLDHGPYGLICTVLNSEGKLDAFVQLSKEESTPIWNFVGEFSQEEEGNILEVVNGMLNK
jgi:hypothetical protein